MGQILNPICKYGTIQFAKCYLHGFSLLFLRKKSFLPFLFVDGLFNIEYLIHIQVFCLSNTTERNTVMSPPPCFGLEWLTDCQPAGLYGQQVGAMWAVEGRKMEVFDVQTLTKGMLYLIINRSVSLASCDVKKTQL